MLQDSVHQKEAICGADKNLAGGLFCLQDCNECTNWDVFREAGTGYRHINLGQ